MNQTNNKTVPKDSFFEALEQKKAIKKILNQALYKRFRRIMELWESINAEDLVDTVNDLSDSNPTIKSTIRSNAFLVHKSLQNKAPEFREQDVIPTPQVVGLIQDLVQAPKRTKRKILDAIITSVRKYEEGILRRLPEITIDDHEFTPHEVRFALLGIGVHLQDLYRIRLENAIRYECILYHRDMSDKQKAKYYMDYLKKSSKQENIQQRIQNSKENNTKINSRDLKDMYSVYCIFPTLNFLQGYYRISREELMTRIHPKFEGIFQHLWVNRVLYEDNSEVWDQ